MFSVAHLVIIFVVALIVFGPEKLPDLARNIGKVMGEFRRATGDLRSTFESHMRDLEREADLRKTREATPAAVNPGLTTGATTGQSPDSASGTTGENTIGGGGSTASLPVSTVEATAATDPADSMKDLPPPAGTVQSERPNASAFREAASPSPQQLQFETQPANVGEQSDSDSQAEKASNGRSRPA
jgi:TatA/E family protein of Tat protein translocase